MASEERGSSPDSRQSHFARRFGPGALDALFPVEERARSLANLLSEGGPAFQPVRARFGVENPIPPAQALKDFGSDIPTSIADDHGALVERIATTFLSGAVNWRNSSLHYNLGAPPTLVSSALYALGLDANVYLINDGLAGRAILAETVVSQLLSKLAGVSTSAARGLFVFGGTGTIAYAIRCGLAKATPSIVRDGLDKSCFVAITEEAHFSHVRSSRWLGLGDSQILTLPAGEHRVTRFEEARELIDARIAAGGRLATIILNGGTTYDHSVDDVAHFRRYIDELVQREALDYRPHIHVDSVIGWEWLFFRDYDFASEHQIKPQTQQILHEQAALITSAIQNADSWGVDFHKGAGCCPIDCSVVQFNDAGDLGYLNGGSRLDDMHQLASELSAHSPADYTLETSRAGAKALAALGSLYALGYDGYRAVLAGLVEAAQSFREEIGGFPDMQIENSYSRGYQSMVRMYPPELAQSPLRATERVDGSVHQREFITAVNSYQRRFVDWDERVRMSRGNDGPYYSYSSKFVPTVSGVGLAGLKFYPTSPRLSNEEAREAARYLAGLKAQFDSEA